MSLLLLLFKLLFLKSLLFSKFLLFFELGEPFAVALVKFALFGRVNCDHEHGSRPLMLLDGVDDCSFGGRCGRLFSFCLLWLLAGNLKRRGWLLLRIDDCERVGLRHAQNLLWLAWLLGLVRLSGSFIRFGGLFRLLLDARSLLHRRSNCHSIRGLPFLRLGFSDFFSSSNATLRLFFLYDYLPLF